LHDAQANPYLEYLDADLLLRLNSTDYERMRAELRVAEQGIAHCSLCELTESRVEERAGQLDAAVAAAKHATADEPTLADGWYRLARLEQHAGNHEAAEQAAARFQQLKTQQRQSEDERMRQMFTAALRGAEQ
jgi:predicted Zn-dependent protease